MEKWILFLCIAACFTGCAKEDELTPSYADRDWYVITDSEDKIGHELFLLYEKYGIPVFVNDTIGREERGVDDYGHPVVYYNIINLDYTLGQTVTDPYVKSKTKTLTKKEEELLAGIDFLDNHLIPMLPEKLHVNSILLLDSLYETKTTGWSEVKQDLKVVLGLTAMAVGQVPQIAKMTDDERSEYAAAILGDLAIKELKKNATSLADFYKVSSKPTTGQGYYNMICAPGSILAPAPFEEYGFLDCAIRYPEDEVTNPLHMLYKTVSQDADLEDFVIACFQYGEEQFAEKYTGYPLVLKKYGMIRALLLQTVYLSK